jgi:uncharacterized membrane protein
MAKESQSRPNDLPIPPVNEVKPGAILRWLKLGWRDFYRAGWPSLMHGLIVAVMGLLIVQVALLFWPLLPGAVSGFLVVGPALATGLYALSQKLEQGQQPKTRDAWDAWRQGTRCLLRFGMLLTIIATAWVMLSVLFFHLFVSVEIDSPTDFLRYVVEQDDHVFLLWTVLGGLVAAVTFAITVVSIPMLVDRDVSTPTALMTSVRAVGENPVTMAAWALFITLASVFSIATLMLGFVVLYPLMGHASWHVYRDVVDAGDLPPREYADCPASE